MVEGVVKSLVNKNSLRDLNYLRALPIYAVLEGKNEMVKTKRIGRIVGSKQVASKTSSTTRA